jgi:hypothetical protein
LEENLDEEEREALEHLRKLTIHKSHEAVEVLARLLRQRTAALREAEARLGEAEDDWVDRHDADLIKPWREAVADWVEARKHGGYEAERLAYEMAMMLLTPPANL